MWTAAIGPKPMLARPRHGAAGALCAGKQTLDALRLFRIGLWRAAGQEGFRVVALLLFGVEGFHLGSDPSFPGVSVVEVGEGEEGLAIGGVHLFRLVRARRRAVGRKPGAAMVARIDR